jgi:hypothetical protein
MIEFWRLLHNAVVIKKMVSEGFQRAPEHRPRLWRKWAVWEEAGETSNANGSEQCDD